MYELLIAAFLVIVLLAAALFFSSRQLVSTNREILAWSKTILQQNCAFNEDQRIYLQNIRALDAEKSPGPISHIPDQSYRPRVPNDPPEVVSAPIPYEG